MQPAGSSDTILVAAFQFNGQGDIYGAHEIYDRVKKLRPQAEVVFTVVKPAFGLFESLMFSDLEFADVNAIKARENWQMLDEKEALSQINRFKTIIVFPTYGDSILPPAIRNRSASVIKLRENGVGESTAPVDGPTYTLGLGPNEKGVLLPSKLSNSVPPQTNPSSLARLAYLQGVDPTYSKTILGQDLSNSSLLEFSKTSKLFIGYFSQDPYFCCFINALLANEKGKNIVVLSTQKRPEYLVESIHETCWQNNFTHIRIYEFKGNTLTEDKKRFDTDKVGNTCTIIFRSLEPKEMEAVLKATEDETITTGDLSPFQFLGHRKVIAYDVRKQKNEAALALIELAATFNPKFKNLMSYAYFGESKPSDMVDVKKVEKWMSLFFKALKNPDLKNHWNRFIDEIFTNHDFTPQLDRILKERIKPFMVSSVDDSLHLSKMLDLSESADISQR
jgi:hypothetical protein